MAILVSGNLRSLYLRCYARSCIRQVKILFGRNEAQSGEIRSQNGTVNVNILFTNVMNPFMTFLKPSLTMSL